MTGQAPNAAQEGKCGALWGGKGTQVGWGQANWGLGAFIAAKESQTFHSDLSICSTLAPKISRFCATPWKLLPLRAVSGGLETNQFNYNSQINQTEGE